MVDDYPEVKERRRRGVVPKARGNLANEWREADTVQSSKFVADFELAAPWAHSPPATSLGLWGSASDCLCSVLCRCAITAIQLNFKDYYK